MLNLRVKKKETNRVDIIFSGPHKIRGQRMFEIVRPFGSVGFGPVLTLDLKADCRAAHFGVS